MQDNGYDCSSPAAPLTVRQAEGLYCLGSGAHACHDHSRCVALITSSVPKPNAGSLNALQAGCPVWHQGALLAAAHRPGAPTKPDASALLARHLGGHWPAVLLGIRRYRVYIQVQ